MHGLQNRMKIAFCVKPSLPSILLADKGLLRCVYTECDEIFRTYNDVGYETVRGNDVKLCHFAWHSRIQW